MKHRLNYALLRRARRHLNNDQGATTLEWCLLLGAVVLASWVLIRGGLALLAGHYGLITTLNQMPFP